MLLNFIKVNFQTKVVVEKYIELISDGVKPSEILVLTQNSIIKKQITDKILNSLKYLLVIQKAWYLQSLFHSPNIYPIKST